MKATAQWIAVKARGRSVVIRDVGGDKDPTITNDAEQVVEDVFTKGLLREGVQLYYLDCHGVLAELKHSCGVFIGFGPAPRDGFVPDIGRVQ